ncbi:MAG: hypothetical protein LBR21_06585 [Propionibacteriaceae bacterium]|jgi:predicted nucleic acid-binding protein|nr:hypothetical protein [Propionibacteriaceae bacterium]
MARQALILDAHILIRAVLGMNVKNLLRSYAPSVQMFISDECLAEAQQHLPEILGKRGVDTALGEDALDAVKGLIQPVPQEYYLPLKDEALARIGYRDPRDWHVLAAALALGCPIWTEDRDFFGVGVATWTTSNVKLFLDDTLSAVLRLGYPRFV